MNTSSNIVTYSCPTFRARLTVAGCTNNQQSMNDNTRRICQGCAAPIAGRVAPDRKTVSQVQRERAKRRRNLDNGKGLQGFKYPGGRESVRREITSRPNGTGEVRVSPAKPAPPPKKAPQPRPRPPKVTGRPRSVGVLKRGKLQTRPGWEAAP